MGNTTLRKLPIGIQDFESLKMDGYLYVDKTEQQIVRIGINFSKETRNIENVLVG